MSIPTSTLNNNEKTVIIIEQCDKKYAILMCECPVAAAVSLLALTTNQTGE